jgi:hypothetical protein
MIAIALVFVHEFNSVINPFDALFKPPPGDQSNDEAGYQDVPYREAEQPFCACHRIDFRVRSKVGTHLGDIQKTNGYKAGTQRGHNRDMAVNPYPTET